MFPGEGKHLQSVKLIRSSHRYLDIRFSTPLLFCYEKGHIFRSYLTTQFLGLLSTEVGIIEQSLFIDVFHTSRQHQS